MKRYFFIIIGLLTQVFAQDMPFNKIGAIRPRHAQEIAANNWSIGGETMDRDIIEFDQFKDFLGPLGAKHIRLQGGWAKCEKEKGVYDFIWLDHIIDGVIAQGVEPWLQTSYGNPVYEGGGGVHLSAGFPTSDEALTAWDNWVYAMAKRYKGRVKIWEIWNEPENKADMNPPEDYARLYIRTAEIIRHIIPDARLYALSMGRIRDAGLPYAEAFLKFLKDRQKLHLVDEITLHGYTYNPSDVYPEYAKFYTLIQQYADHIKIRQGELGCPSENQAIYALRNYEWTELSQSKWVLRKMLGDLGRDIPSSYFLIIDAVYTHNHQVKMETPRRNTKGLIQSDLNRKFVALKPAYHAYQHVTSIFDGRLRRIPNYAYRVSSDSSLSVFGYCSKHFDKQIVTIWLDGRNPSNSNQKINMDFEFPAGQFESPVYVDLRTGAVYEIPHKNRAGNGTHFEFKQIPVYDSPVCIADKSLVLLQ